MKTPRRATLASVSLLTVLCVALSLAVGWTSFARRVDLNFYDLYFRFRGPLEPAPQIALIVIDDDTLARYGALPLRRSLLADAVRAIRLGAPRLIALDLLLVDTSSAAEDRALESALSGPTPIVLASALAPGGARGWLTPLPRFAQHADAVGHVHADPDGDGVSRQVFLSRQSGRERFWAFALECLRVGMGTEGQPVTETDLALELPAGENFSGSIASPGLDSGPIPIPATLASSRAFWINYAGQPGTFPRISLAALLDNPGAAAPLHDKIVLIGVTAQGTGDRLFVPFFSGAGMPGVEIHANILHTLLNGTYLQPAGNLPSIAALLGIALLSLFSILRFRGIAQWALLAVLGFVVLAAPYLLFIEGQIWPSFSLLLAFGLTSAVGEGYQLLVVGKKYERSEARRELAHQQFEMATHEMRTPLAAIQASSELLAGYPLDEARRERMIQLLKEESHRLARLVDRFLSVERLSTGEMELKLGWVELDGFFSDMVSRLEPLAERRSVELELASPDEPVRLEADAELLEFAVSNLVTNAIKYSPSGTRVRITWDETSGRARIEVADSGPGMEQADASRVFDRFFRTSSAQQSGTPGFGLGLAIAREITHHHGGEVQVESTPGAGTRFILLLPLTGPAGRSNSSEEGSAPSS